MRYLLTVLITLSISCGEETSRPVKKRADEMGDMGVSQEVGVEDVSVEEDADLLEEDMGRLDLESLEQIDFPVDHPEFENYRDSFRVKVKDLSFPVILRDFGLD